MATNTEERGAPPVRTVLPTRVRVCEAALRDWMERRRRERGAYTVAVEHAPLYAATSEWSCRPR